MCKDDLLGQYSNNVLVNLFKFSKSFKFWNLKSLINSNWLIFKVMPLNETPHWIANSIVLVLIPPDNKIGTFWNLISLNFSCLLIMSAVEIVCIVLLYALKFSSYLDKPSTSNKILFLKGN